MGLFKTYPGITFSNRPDYQLLDELIETYRLHQTLNYPVSAQPLYDALNVRIYWDLKLPRGIEAFSQMHRTEGFGIAGFRQGLKAGLRQYALFHEIGHLLFHVHGEVHRCVSSPAGVIQQEEYEADLAAAYLAVPGRTLLELGRDYTEAQVCSILGVTPRLYHLRVKIMLANNEFGISNQ